jgi:kynurenine formamidase
MLHPEITAGGKRFRLQAPVDIAIPLIFNGPQPNTYGVPAAESHPYEGSGFVGDVRQGSGCNFEVYTFVPHCNGTHTECIGHITADRISVHDTLHESLMLCVLLDVEPERADNQMEAYVPALNPEDRVLTRAALASAWERAGVADMPVTACAIRTLPNDPGKASRDYMQQHPPFFTLDGMAFLVEKGVEHLLVDMPSVDRLFDEGKLTAHHIFWNVPQGTHTPTPESRIQATITEMILVPDALVTGVYVLELQIAAFVSDAAPSRPRLWPLAE